MSGTERAESAPARSAHVIHVMPAAWPDVAARLASLVARAGATDGPSMLVLVPSAGDALPLAETLRGTADPAVRVLPLVSVRRARRLTRDGGAHIVVAPPGIVLALVRSSTLSLAGVGGVALVAADELEADRAALEQLLAEIPRGAAKVVTCAWLTPFVESLATAHMHGARRLEHAAAAAAPGAAVPVEVLPVSPAAPLAPLPDLLELTDAPSVAVVPADDVRGAAAGSALEALGYGADGPLARVAPDGAAAPGALVVLAGVPPAAVLAAALGAAPARVVALVSARERAVLEARVGADRVVPFTPSPARDDAAAAEETLRDRLRKAIRAGLPSREMLALEPLLAEFDALTVAGAVLRMHEARLAAEARAPRPAAPRADAPRPPRPPRPPRGDAPRPSRGGAADRGRPRDDRPRFGDDRPRRDDRGPRRDDRGPRRDDRGPRRDDRGPRGGRDRS